jgi:hypothetical protein
MKRNKFNKQTTKYNSKKADAYLQTPCRRSGCIEVVAAIWRWQSGDSDDWMHGGCREDAPHSFSASDLPGRHHESSEEERVECSVMAMKYTTFSCV